MAPELEATAFTATPVFDRVVCGVDLSGAGRTAARCAAQLVAPFGSLLLVTATVGEPVVAASPVGLGAHSRTRRSTRLPASGIAMR